MNRTPVSENWDELPSLVAVDSDSDIDVDRTIPRLRPSRMDRIGRILWSDDQKKILQEAYRTYMFERKVHQRAHAQVQPLKVRAKL